MNSLYLEECFKENIAAELKVEQYLITLQGTMGLAWVEWMVVITSLVITLVVGAWFSRRGKGSLQEYMLGNRRMTVLPISLSIAATYLTGSAMVSSAQESYLYGMQAAVHTLNYAVIGTLSAWIYLPVSYSIKSASSFQFFERRFNCHIRKLASFTYALETIQHTAMSQYIPAVALSQASGLPTFPLACLLTLICLGYTAAGGLKAVAWADSFQAAIFTVCAALVAITGTYMAGGPMEVWRKGEEGSRMEFFNLDLSPDIRYTAVNVLVGGVIMMSQIHMSPSFHQRVSSMPTFQRAREVVIWSSLFAAIFIGFEFSTGLIVYAYFAGCDPVLAKKGIYRYSAILPYFVNQISDHFPGLEGLFLSGVLAAGLSTTTSCWNTVACTVYEDFVVPWVGPSISKKASFRYLMGIVIIFGAMSTAFILIIQSMASLQEATVAMKAMTMPIHFILYNGGMFLPWVNSKGILAGSAVTGAMTLYIVLGAQYAKKNKLVRDLPKILTTAKCIVNGTTMEALNITTSIGSEGYGLVTLSDPSVPWLFRMSLMLYMVPGTILGLVVSYLVSLMTGGQDLAEVDREMIIPLMHWALPRQLRSKEDNLEPLETTNLQE